VTEVPAVRASNAEREQTVRTLREHCVAGRLTLETVLQELPRAAAAERRRPKRLTFGAFGGFERRGRGLRDDRRLARRARDEGRLPRHRSGAQGAAA
jgi:hypothetical protein